MLKNFFILSIIIFILLIFFFGANIAATKSDDEIGHIAIGYLIFGSLVIFFYCFLILLFLVLLFDLYHDFGLFGFVIFFIFVQIYFFMLWNLPDIRIKNYSINIAFSYLLLSLLFYFFYHS
jgi:hypothetical protein